MHPFVAIVVHFFLSRKTARINTSILLKIEDCKEGYLHIVKPTNAPVLKLHILYTICHNSDMLQSVLIILRVTEYQLSIYKNTDRLLNALKFVLKIRL